MTEKQFCKLDEYSGELPNPMSFPVQGEGIVAIDGHPNTFTDGFMMDFSVTEDDRQKLEKLVTRTASEQAYNSLLEDAKQAVIQLSKPQYIYIGGVFIAYVLSIPYAAHIGIQVKYYRYFINRYPGCNFYTSKEQWEQWNVKQVKVMNKTVGLLMPLGIPPVVEGT
ncbi:hypothetical protein KKF82_08025 [Patescibacteria group bacterium]|uniref:Uncharacterized protein n=1 Tax=viral metagenome TaxID=1070528 RepID=A0A6M3M4J6_9ZZZZ|nr:hypothetical protein [Patescibacteria group bacterium]